VNARDFTRYGRYIRRVADQMMLQAWTFTLMHDPPERDDALAVVEPWDGRKAARIWLCVDFDTFTPEVQRHTIVHEMLHMHMTGASDVMRLDTCDHLSQAVYDTLMSAFKRQVEYAVDGIADSVSEFFPLPKARK
jgi:hypothetical protein